MLLTRFIDKCKQYLKTIVQTGQIAIWHLSDLCTPTEDETPSYADCEAIPLYITMDIIDAATRTHTPAMEGEPVSTARGLLGLAACAIQYTKANLITNATAEDKQRIKELGDAVSFTEIRKRSPLSPMCTAFSDNPSDAYLLLELETLTTPFAQHQLMITFAPTSDGKPRAYMKPEEAVAVMNHRRFFFEGGLTLAVTSSIPLPPELLWQITLTALLSYEQNGVGPLSYDGGKDKPGYMDTLLRVTPQDPSDGYRPTPWLTPTITKDGANTTWKVLNSSCTIKDNKTLSFCPGMIVKGEIKPYVILATNESRTKEMFVSIANGRVYQLELHLGSRGPTNVGIMPFPNTMLENMAGAPSSQWTTDFKLFSAGTQAATYPKHVAIRFGAHRFSIYGSPSSARSSKKPPFYPSIKDPARRDFAGAYIKKPTIPNIYATPTFLPLEEMISSLSSNPGLSLSVITSKRGHTPNPEDIEMH